MAYNEIEFNIMRPTREDVTYLVGILTRFLVAQCGEGIHMWTILVFLPELSRLLQVSVYTGSVGQDRAIIIWLVT